MYKNEIEQFIGNGWEYEKIIRIKDRSLRYYLIKRENAEYLADLRKQFPEEANEIEEEERYHSYMVRGEEYHKKVIDTVKELGREVKEIEIHFKDSRDIKDFIKL